jgi:hypothetical protein
VKTSNEPPRDDSKWRLRSTVLFVILVCGGFWALLIWAIVKWLH